MSAFGCDGCGARFGAAREAEACPLCGGVVCAREPVDHDTPPGTAAEPPPERLVHRGHKSELIAGTLDARPVVVKRVRPDRRGDPRMTERLAREAELLRAIDSPWVIDLVDEGREPCGAPFLLLPRYAGSVRDADASVLTGLGGIVFVAAAMARGLAALHERRALHRDLHPGNVLHGPLDGRGERVVLADLGHAHGRGAPPLTPEGHTVGTVGYIAPEVLGGARATAASDVYAWAVTLFETAGGQRPFEHPEPLVEMARAQEERAFPLRSYEKRLPVPRWLEDLVDAALDRRPSARPTLVDLLEATRDAT